MSASRIVGDTLVLGAGMIVREPSPGVGVAVSVSPDDPHENPPDEAAEVNASAEDMRYGVALIVPNSLGEEAQVSESESYNGPRLDGLLVHAFNSFSASLAAANSAYSSVLYFQANTPNVKIYIALLVQQSGFTAWRAIDVLSMVRETGSSRIDALPEGGMLHLLTRSFSECEREVREHLREKARAEYYRQRTEQAAKMQATLGELVAAIKSLAEKRKSEPEPLPAPPRLPVNPPPHFPDLSKVPFKSRPMAPVRTSATRTMRPDGMSRLDISELKGS